MKGLTSGFPDFRALMVLEGSRGRGERSAVSCWLVSLYTTVWKLELRESYRAPDAMQAWYTKISITIDCALYKSTLFTHSFGTYKPSSCHRPGPGVGVGKQQGTAFWNRCSPQVDIVLNRDREWCGGRGGAGVRDGAWGGSC